MELHSESFSLLTTDVQEHYVYCVAFQIVKAQTLQ